MEVCTSCPRAGDDVGTCGSTITCPKTTRPIDPTRDVVIHCSLCDKTRAASAASMVHGRSLRLEMGCPTSEGTCHAGVVVPPSATPASPPTAAGPNKAAKRGGKQD